MTDDVVTIARATTIRGDLALRERHLAAGPVHELIVAGVFAMDSVDVSTEETLARSALANCGRPVRVLVGGLGLGYTAAAVLADPRVEEVVIAEIEGPLIEWAVAGLTPQLAAIAGSSRVQLREQDIAMALRQSETYDAILLDVDNGPSFLVHEHNAALYSDSWLAQAITRLAPGGVLSIWAAQREPVLLERLRRTGARSGAQTVQEQLFQVERDGRMFEYAIYHLRR